MVWRLRGQTAKTHLQKILTLQKRVLHLMYFSETKTHAVPLFISSKILPLQMLYAEKVSSIMFDVSCMNAPFKICDFQTSRPNLNQDSFCRFGAKLWNAIPNEFRQLSKRAFRKNFRDFLLISISRGRLCWSAHSPTKNGKFCSLDSMH